jgi:hypothetical protein
MTSAPEWLRDLATVTGGMLTVPRAHHTLTHLLLPATTLSYGRSLLGFAITVAVTPLDQSVGQLVELEDRLEVASAIIGLWGQISDISVAEDQAALATWRSIVQSKRRAPYHPPAQAAPLVALHRRLRTSPGYEVLGLACQRGLRVACARLAEAATRGDLPKRTATARASRLVLPLEYLCQFGSFSGIQVQPDGGFSLPMPIITAAMESAMRSVDTRFTDPATRDKYVALAWQVLSGTYTVGPMIPPEERPVRPPTAPGRRTWSARLGPPIRDPEWSQALIEGSHPDEVSGQSRWVESRYPLSLIHEEASSSLASEFPVWFARSAPPVPVLARTLAGLVDEPFGRAISWLLLVTGWRPRHLTAVGYSSETFPYFDVVRSVLVVEHGPEGLAQESRGPCLPGGRMLAIPVTGPMMQLLQEAASRGRRSIVEPEELTRLAQTVRVCAERAGVRCDLNTFRRAFLPLAVGRGALDPVEAAYVSGVFHDMARVPSAYTNLRQADLVRQCVKFQQSLYEELRRASGGRLPPWVTVSFPARLFPGGFGSSLVPQDGPFGRWCRAAERDVVRADPPAEAFSRYMVKRALDLEVLTGIRPEELRDLELRGVDLEGRLLFVKGEDTTTFIESRVAPLVPAAVAIVRDVLTVRAKLLRWAAQTGRAGGENSAEVGGSRLFLIVVGDRVAPLAIEQMRTVLTHGFPEAGPFPFAANSPRHLVRTRLSRRRVSCEIINALLGHQVGGQEYFGRIGLGTLAALRNAVERPLSSLVPLLGHATR